MLTKLQGMSRADEADSHQRACSAQRNQTVSKMVTVASIEMCVDQYSSCADHDGNSIFSYQKFGGDKFGSIPIRVQIKFR